VIGAGSPLDLVVCSLEAWDEIWRRNQFLVDGLLRRNPRLRVLFVEPPHDLVHGLRGGRMPRWPHPRGVGGTGRLWTLQPVKPLPRRAGPWSDRALWGQVRRAARWLGLRDPVLWVNDTTYGPLIARTGWRSVYDVTDDWLLVPVPRRESARRRRLEAVTLRDAARVVVCSPALAASRGAIRPVTLIPNGVEVEHFTRPRPRPPDLPPSPVAVYVGTLHAERIDVELIVELVTRLPDLSLALVGPDALDAASRRRLATCDRVWLLGPRRYESVPGYLQHADVVVVPHRVTPFTDSLDPIKAYECLVVARPTVATNVAGFRALGPPIAAVAPEAFPTRVAQALRTGMPPAAAPPDDLSWEDRCDRFEAVLSSLTAGRRWATTRAPRPRGSCRQTSSRIGCTPR
jgi:teichuronic acid biosynthesis glycosyltransferase TuaH